MKHEQPEALRLVNNRQNAHLISWQANACAELRRLHALNAELLEALKELVAQTDTNFFAIKHDHVALQNARAAIAKAEGEQK